VEQVGLQVDEPGAQSQAAAAVPLADDGFVEFKVAGASAKGDFRCTDCGYGAVVQRTLPTCPMCAGEIWELRPPGGSRFL
jgi:hypothetical protein